jgi:hypothetical protein
MTADIEAGIRTLWKQAFNGRDLDALDAITAPGFVNHNALPGTPPGPEVTARCSSASGRRSPARTS